MSKINAAADALLTVSTVGSEALKRKAGDYKLNPDAVAIFTTAYKREEANGKSPGVKKILMAGLADAAKVQKIAAVTCPGCDTPNFSPAGLKAHKCKGVKRDALVTTSPKPAAIDGKAEVTSGAPQPATEDPRWLAVKETAGRLREAGRTYLEIQAWLGWQLAQLKKDHGVKRGNNGLGGSAESADPRTWDELVKHYTGYSRRTADVLIQLFDAAVAKLKKGKSPEQKSALTLFNQGNPLAMPPDKREIVREIIAGLCAGETQGSLMAEFGVIPMPKAPPAGPKKKAERELTAGELARCYFEPLAAELLRLRSDDGEFDKLIIALPPHPDEENRVALSCLEDDARAVLAKIEAARAKLAKPASPKKR